MQRDTVRDAAGPLPSILAGAQRTAKVHMFGNHPNDESAPRRPNGRKPWAQRARACAGPALAFCAALGAAGLLAQTQCTTVAGLDELTFTGTGFGAWLSSWGGWGGEGGTDIGIGDGGSGAGGAAVCGTTPTPPEAACPEEICNGGCPDPTTCLITCAEAGSSPCASNELTCPPGFHCLVECGTLPGCAGTEIVCPPTYDCLVRCDELQSCFNTDVLCSATGTCAVECSAAVNSCAEATLTCGENSCHGSCNGEPQLEVACGSSCDCLECL